MFHYDTYQADILPQHIINTLSITILWLTASTIPRLHATKNLFFRILGVIKLRNFYTPCNRSAIKGIVYFFWAIKKSEEGSKV